MIPKGHRYRLGIGTVQCHVVRKDPWYFRVFGPCEYDSAKPIMPLDLQRNAEEIVDSLNLELITLEEAERRLDAL